MDLTNFAQYITGIAIFDIKFGIEGLANICRAELNRFLYRFNGISMHINDSIIKLIDDKFVEIKKNIKDKILKNTTKKYIEVGKKTITIFEFNDYILCIVVYAILKNINGITMSLRYDRSYYDIHRKIFNIFEICTDYLYELCDNPKKCDKMHEFPKDAIDAHVLNLLKLRVCPKKNCTCMLEHSLDILYHQDNYQSVIQEFTVLKDIDKINKQFFMEQRKIKQECPICYEKETECILLCGHKFCRYCCHKFVNLCGDTCPTCRTRIKYILGLENLIPKVYL